MIKYILPKKQIAQERIHMTFEIYRCDRAKIAGVFVVRQGKNLRQLCLVRQRKFPRKSQNAMKIMKSKGSRYLLSWLYNAPSPLAISVAKSLSITHVSSSEDRAAASIV